jgi:catechol 2,3-dioxygenase-like lactoylglutathione lyase family enzyme
MYVGHPTFCLKVSDPAASRRFYEALGLEVIEHSDTNLVLRRGHFTLALMTFSPKDCLNFRRVDPFAIQAHLQAQGLALAGERQRGVPRSLPPARARTLRGCRRAMTHATHALAARARLPRAHAQLRSPARGRRSARRRSWLR